MRALRWSTLSAAERTAALARPARRADPALREQVRAIVEDVCARGWAAVCDHAERLDGAAPKLVPIAPLAEEARRTLPTEALRALDLAHRNISRFHTATLPGDDVVEVMEGLLVRRLWRPLDRVGLYIPGGRTPLFSTLMMLAIPARAAGVSEIVAVTPPRYDGGLDPLIALAADMCGIGAIWTVGGAQAIAALAFGAGDIPPVAKICGPGNAWVAEAKACLASLPGAPAIDLPAGPSELMVIADAKADPRLVAADLLAQAEHDASAQVLLVTTGPALADAVRAELAARGARLPRHQIVAEALRSARAIVVASLEEAAAVANLYAPEHLSLAVEDPEALVGQVRNAGAIFAGEGAAETFGDYLAGPSHVLPTDGAARAWSGVSALTFLKAISVQSIDEAAARRLAAPAALLAHLEGLEAHALAAELRIREARP